MLQRLLFGGALLLATFAGQAQSIRLTRPTADTLAICTFGSFRNLLTATFTGFGAGQRFALLGYAPGTDTTAGDTIIVEDQSYYLSTARDLYTHPFSGRGIRFRLVAVGTGVQSNLSPALTISNPLGVEFDGSQLRYIGVYGSAFYFHSRQSANYTDADTTARALGGTLACINGPTENAWIATRINNQRSWTGGNDIAVEDQYVWATGQKFAYTNWAQGEPNDNGGNPEPGVEILGDGLWNDERTSTGRRFVVEVPMLGVITNAPVCAGETFKIKTAGGRRGYRPFKLSIGTGMYFDSIIVPRVSSGIVTVTTRLLAYRDTMCGFLRPGFFVTVYNADPTAPNPELVAATLKLPGKLVYVSAGSALLAVHNNIADGLCARMGTLKDSSEWRLIDSVLDNSTFRQREHYIGLTDTAAEGRFRWADGDSLSIANWAPNEPNDFQGGEDFVSMSADSTRRWNDVATINPLGAIYEVSCTPRLSLPGGRLYCTNTIAVGIMAPSGCELDANAFYFVKMIDQLGRVIDSVILSNANGQNNAFERTLPNGLYILTLADLVGKRFDNQRIVMQGGAPASMMLEFVFPDTLKVVGAPAGATFNWIAGINTVGENRPFVTRVVPDVSYAVVVTLPGGCTVTLGSPVSVKPKLPAAALVLVPNPSPQNGLATLRLHGQTLRQVEVLSATGQRLHTQTILATEVSLPSGLPAGMYLVRATVDTGQVLMQRWVVE